MRAMILQDGKQELQLVELPIPEPNVTQVLIKVQICGVCRTDLHIIDGELEKPKLDLIPGHQVVGIITKVGEQVSKFKVGERVGVSWLNSSCGICQFCTHNQENLCDQAIYTGYTINGGFSEYCVANAEYCFAIPTCYSDIQAAPLLCAGIVSYRAYRKIMYATKIGIYGFGSAGHILCQVAKFQNKKLYVFTRPDDQNAQDFALQLGADWAGSSTQDPPELLDAAIIFAPQGELIPRALGALNKGGTVVCGGIHMSEIPSFSYDLLWGERCICSVANLTRQDGIEFLELASKIPIETKVTTYSLEQANQALNDLRSGAFVGSAVICI